MAKRRRSKKRTTNSRPYGHRGSEKWRVAGIRGNLRQFLDNATTLQPIEWDRLKRVKNLLDLTLRDWDDENSTEINP